MTYGNMKIHKAEITDSGRMMLEADGWWIAVIDKDHAERLMKMLERAYRSGRADQRRDIQAVLGIKP